MVVVAQLLPITLFVSGTQYSQRRCHHGKCPEGKTTWLVGIGCKGIHCLSTCLSGIEMAAML